MSAQLLRRGATATLASVLLALAVSQPVAAQPADGSGPAHSFDELTGRLLAGASISVTDAAGQEVTGKLRQISGNSLEVLVGGQPRRFTEPDVALVRERRADPLWNGLLIGAAAGIAPAVYWLIVDPNECGGSICMTDLITGVIPGAAIGLAVDAAIRRKVVIFRNPSSPRTAGDLKVGLISRQGRRGIEVTFLVPSFEF